MSAARTIIDILCEGQPAAPLTEASQVLRFDVNARVEVFITDDDLEYDRAIEKIKVSGQPFEAKKAAAMQRALELAGDKVTTSSRNGLEITASLTLQDINWDRIDWVALLEPEPEEVEEL